MESNEFKPNFEWWLPENGENRLEGRLSLLENGEIRLVGEEAATKLLNVLYKANGVVQKEIVLGRFYDNEQSKNDTLIGSLIEDIGTTIKNEVLKNIE